jgi:hypothetical protein
VDPSVQSILSTTNAGGGSEALQWQVAPSYSELFGLGVRTTVGGYSTAEIQNSSLSINFDRIEGKHVISDDTRVDLNWTVGFGAGGAGGSNVTAYSMGSMARADLLADVSTRPSYLPERVLARGNSVDHAVCDPTNAAAVTPPEVGWFGQGRYSSGQKFQPEQDRKPYDKKQLWALIAAKSQ